MNENYHKDLYGYTNKTTQTNPIKEVTEPAPMCVASIIKAMREFKEKSSNPKLKPSFDCIVCMPEAYESLTRLTEYVLTTTPTYNSLYGFPVYLAHTSEEAMAIIEMECKAGRTPILLSSKNDEKMLEEANIPGTTPSLSDETTAMLEAHEKLPILERDKFVSDLLFKSIIEKGQES